MSNNNRREPPNNYPTQRNNYSQRARSNQLPQYPHQPPYNANPHYPPSYYPPPPFYPPYKEEPMRHPYNQPPMQNSYFYPPFGHYPMPYSSYPPMPFPQQSQNDSQTPERRNYESRTHENRQERNNDYKQKIEIKRKPYERNERPQFRNEKSYESRERSRNVQPCYERTDKKEESEKKREDSDEFQPDENDSSSDSESEEVIYHRKAIAKKKDPILDSKQEIRKWIEARKRNYPKQSIKPDEAQRKIEQSEMSLLQKKIRKKILLINADPRSMMKKQKDIDILRRFILYSRRAKRNIALPPRRFERQEQQEPIQSQPLLPVPEEDERVQKQPEPLMIKPEEGMPEEGEDAVEQPIKSQRELPREEQPREREYGRREELSVDVIIKHLQMKQSQDSKTLESLMDYKSNSFHYRYQHQTLETNLLLDSIFNQTSYILQAIRYIVKNKFFEQQAK